MSRKPRRQRSTATPAQMWRILPATAREARIALHHLAAETPVGRWGILTPWVSRPAAAMPV